MNSKGLASFVENKGGSMPIYSYIKAIFAGGLIAVVMVTAAAAEKFDIPSGDLAAALTAFTTQSGVALIVSGDAVKGARTKGVKGTLSTEDALSHILSGTGFVTRRDTSGAIAVVRDGRAANDMPLMHLAAAPVPTLSGAALETVTVTSSKIGGDIQNIPISITALSQEQLTATQTAGGPDLVKQVPNLTFTKTNFSGYSIQIRGIGTQAISVTTDPAVAVAFNDIPFIRNHFFEQEFYDVSQVEVLRGPQGTLYGRNATAGVVNLISAKPTDQFEAMASLDIGNYGNRRPEGMINIPIVDDRLDIRIAGEWTKRNGYSFDSTTGTSIDGRDLWSGRVTIGWKPVESIQTYLIWEHFSESDDRLRSAKQLCKTDPGLAEVGGVSTNQGTAFYGGTAYFSQGCLPTSLYSADAFEVPNGLSLPYYLAGGVANTVNSDVNPYAEARQSRNLRVIESSYLPKYSAKNNTVEFNADWAATPALTLTSQTGFNQDFLYSTEDYNRFASSPGLFIPGSGSGAVSSSGVFCDPQLGCSSGVLAGDLSDEHAWQLGQEFRLASNFGGPLNFSAGANYLHYETEENYYVFINAITLFKWAFDGAGDGGFNGGEPLPWIPGVSDNVPCLGKNPFTYQNPKNGANGQGCGYIDPNSVNKLNNEGHNYFLSQNPYTLNSYAGFGEAYYQATKDLKLILGARWTDDRKHFVQIPSWVGAGGWGYPIAGTIDQQWNEWTGRFAANWTPKLDFTDQTLIYASVAHGYKAGGANPPGAVILESGDLQPTHPFTFKPEFIQAFELGSKNTALDGALTLNGDVFYYNYTGYQISQIIDRTAINLNFNAHVEGAELEATYEPIAGLRFNFAGGYENTVLAKGSQAVDLIDRTAGDPNWALVKPFITYASNCILPVYVVADILKTGLFVGNLDGQGLCGEAYAQHIDPVTEAPYVPNPTMINCGFAPPNPPTFCPLPAIFAGYPGFNPDAAPNGGAGIDKNLSGNKLPNAPPFTVSFGAQYTLPLTTDWAGTARGDYYWQDYSWARVFNDNPYDRLRGYTNVNLTLIFTNQNGWQVMLYDKNVFNMTTVTGAFLNSDDTGLTTNVFLTDPKLIGIRVTKNW
jgi:iron complex outermembrane recepter protein